MSPPIECYDASMESFSESFSGYLKSPRKADHPLLLLLLLLLLVRMRCFEGINHMQIAS